MDDGNSIIEQIDAALTSKRTPLYARPMLLWIRDDHTRLRRHLDWHASWKAVLATIAVACVTVVAVGLTVWLLGPRLPFLQP